MEVVPENAQSDFYAGDDPMTENRCVHSLVKEAYFACSKH